MNKFMKKIAFAIMLVLACAVTFTGCAGLDSALLGDIKPSTNIQNPRKLGKTVGRGAVLAYVICKSSGKNEEALAQCEEIWKKLQADDGTVTIADINNLAIEMGSAAVADKEGWVYGAAVATAMQIAGAYADKAIGGQLDIDTANEFLAGLVEGANLTLASLPADAFTPSEKEESVKVFDCPEGNCTITASSRDVKYQRRLAQQLIDEERVNPDEVVKEGHNAYTNCKDLVSRCKKLRTYKVDETRCYLHHVVLDEKGMVKEIEFRMILDDTEIVTNCVGCEQYYELADLPDDIEF